MRSRSAFNPQPTALIGCGHEIKDAEEKVLKLNFQKAEVALLSRRCGSNQYRYQPEVAEFCKGRSRITLFQILAFDTHSAGLKSLRKFNLGGYEQVLRCTQAFRLRGFAEDKGPG